MSPEGWGALPKQHHDTEATLLARGFRELPETRGESVFDSLERDLLDAHFSLAAQSEVMEVFNDPSLITRSETFSKVMDLVLEDETLTITDRGDANMCIIAGGTGFRIAMQEGFSGKDVEGIVKTVLTFKPDHLSTRTSVPRDSKLWETKPETAQVSLIGGGEVHAEDVVMVSFRFPVQYFPKHMLTESERDLFEEDQIRFIVRHYVPHKEKTMQ